MGTKERHGIEWALHEISHVADLVDDEECVENFREILESYGNARRSYPVGVDEAVKEALMSDMAVVFFQDKKGVQIGFIQSEALVDAFAKKTDDGEEDYYGYGMMSLGGGSVDSMKDNHLVRLARGLGVIWAGIREAFVK